MNRKIIPIREELTSTSDCAYKAGQKRRFTALVAEPNDDSEALAFKEQIIKEGYEDVHLPHVAGSLSCLFCQACVPLRIAVQDFAFSANQRKFMKKNADLLVSVSKTYFDPEEYNLYLNHFASRFAKHDKTPETIYDYLKSKLTHTHVQTLRHPQSKRLLGMLFFEDYGDGIYASTQIYDPTDSTARSLGHFGILKLVEYAQAQSRIKHIYLGSWVKDSDLVGYKQRYQALEAKIGSGPEGWVKFDPDKHTKGYRPPHIQSYSIELP